MNFLFKQNQLQYVQLNLTTFAPMRNIAVKISALLLCGLFFYNSLGYFLVLSAMRVAVRHQKWAQLSAIPESQLTKFVFNSSANNPRLKILNDHEIIVDGKLYDIARMTIDGSTTTYYGVRDYKEETLIAKTRQFHSSNQDMPFQDTPRLIVEKIIKTAVVENKSAACPENYIAILSGFTEAPYSGPYLQITVPPPQS